MTFNRSKEMELPSETSRDWSREILDSIATGLFTTDTDFRVTFFNKAAGQIIGLESDAVLGQTCREVFKSTLCDQGCPLRRAMQTLDSQPNQEAVFIRQGGRSVVPVTVSASPLIGPGGEVEGGVETFHPLEMTKILERKSRRSYAWEEFVGSSPHVAQILDTLKVVSHTDVTVLIEGPTGTGKDLLTHMVHHHSPRRNQPFIKVNCAALPENLLESEMFGYVRGAFTGADKDKPGRFQMAEGGSIFLDEISELPLSLQAKLLRVIEDKEFYPLGARKTAKVDVRILAATNRPLDQLVKDGLFRADLFFRLNIIRIDIPPLKDRRQDIPILIRRFIQRKNITRGTYICRFSPEALDCLLNYDYPGNVRELDNILEHACILCQGDVIQEIHLPTYFSRTLMSAAEAEAVPTTGCLSPRDSLLAVLSRHGWNRGETARYLGIDRTTLWRRMKRWGIQVPK